MIAYLALAAALTLVAFGQLNFKLYALRSSRLRLAIAMSCFAIAQICFFVALFDLHIGVVYLSTALTQVLVLFLSHYVLRETLTRHHAVAMTMIVAGLVLYAG